jgi:hypothetical protein
MLVVPDRFLGLSSLQVWFPDSAKAVIDLLPRAATVTAMQCSDTVADELDAYAFRARDFHTMLIDLTLSEGELWDRLEKRTCRYQINRAKKMNVAVVLNERLDEAYELFADFIRRRKFRPPLSRAEWERITACCDIFVAVLDNVATATHAIVRDPPRVRALMSATVDRAESAARAAASALNRYLHWHEFNHYRALGFTEYDFGGAVIDEHSPEYAITEFKMTFSGERSRQHILRLAGNPLLRLLLRGSARGMARLSSARRGRPKSLISADSERQKVVEA